MQFKVPPYSKEAEEAVLGALLNGAILEKVKQLISKEDFYIPVNQGLFQMICMAHDKGWKEVNWEVLINAFPDQIHGTCHKWLKNLQQTTSRHDYLAYAEIVKERSLLRKLIKQGNEIIELSKSPNLKVNEMLDELEGKLFKLAEESVPPTKAKIKTQLKVKDLVDVICDSAGEILEILQELEEE